MIIWRKNPHYCSVGRGKFLIIWKGASIVRKELTSASREWCSSDRQRGHRRDDLRCKDSLLSVIWKQNHRIISALWELFFTYNQKQNWFVIIMIHMLMAFYLSLLWILRSDRSDICKDHRVTYKNSIWGFIFQFFLQKICQLISQTSKEVRTS